jgi:hypothetical protein
MRPLVSSCLLAVLVMFPLRLAALGASPSLHREPLVTITRPARARRDDREYRKYLREEKPGCSALRMQMELPHELLGPRSRGPAVLALPHP